MIFLLKTSVHQMESDIDEDADLKEILPKYRSLHRRRKKPSFFQKKLK